MKSRLLRIQQLLPFFALSLGVPVSCFAQWGGNGRRACCLFEKNFNVLPCDGGLAYSTSLNCTDPNGCSCSGRIIRAEVSLGIVTGPLPAVARGNEPVATATRRLALAADERKDQSPLFPIKHSIPFRGAV